MVVAIQRSEVSKKKNSAEMAPLEAPSEGPPEAPPEESAEGAARGENYFVWLSQEKRTKYDLQ